jgi:hypothetical protein
MTSITINTSDEVDLELERKYVDRFITLKNMCADLGDTGDVTVSCPSHDIMFLTAFVDEYDNMPIDASLLFQEKTKEEVMSIYQTANYLAFEEALHECAQILYDRISSMDNKEIRKFFSSVPRKESKYEDVKKSLKWVLEPTRQKTK